MNVMNDLKKMVVNGFVLDKSGRWVHLKQAVELSRDLSRRTSRGEVFDGTVWITAEARKRRLRRQKEENKKSEGQGDATLVRLSDDRMWFTTQEMDGGVVEIRLGGYVDRRNVHTLKEGLQTCIAAGHIRLLINLEQVRHLSSAGWGMLSAILPGIRKRGGELLVYAMRRAVREEFVGMQFDKVFNTCEKKSDVYKFFQHAPQQNTNGMEIEQDTLTTEEIIKREIAREPLLSTRQLRKRMRAVEQGVVNIGLFAFRRMLREMDLETKEKRERFSRSW